MALPGVENKACAFLESDIERYENEKNPSMPEIDRMHFLRCVYCKTRVDSARSMRKLPALEYTKKATIRSK